MIGKRTLTNGRELAGKQCTYCEGRVIREEIRNQFHILYIPLFTVSTRQRTYCKSCRRTLERSEIKTKPQVKVQRVQEYDGTVKTVKTEQKTGFETVTTRWDQKNQLPPTEHPELLAKTLIALMAYLEQIDPTIVTTDHDNYEYIRESYREYQEAVDEVEHKIQTQSIEQGLRTVQELFAQSKAKLLTKDLQFIVDQGLSLTSHQFFLSPAVNDLFRNLFLEIGYTELGLERGINNSRVKWMSNQ